MTSSNNNTFNPDDMFTGHLSYVSKSPIESIKSQSRLFPRNTDSLYPTPQSALYMGRFVIDHDSVSTGILPTGHWGSSNEQSTSSWGSQIGQIDPQTSQQEIDIYQPDTSPATLATHSPYAMYSWKHWGRVVDTDNMSCQIMANSNGIGIVPSPSSIMNKYLHGAIGRVHATAGHYSTVKSTGESSLTSAYNFYEDLNSFELPDPANLMFDEEEEDSSSEGSQYDMSLIGVEEESTATDIEDDSSDFEVSDNCEPSLTG
ncbi:hypothetical protein WICPIJ_007567 [Wickerhamomyces pijperi]|uniref:Uncharacterized protein n=1 Tax=Wickerhamomyces pijperi TaxID=599730 RepID=A0A9P8Q010_WICPI|nr:hypothetical protein WICPIJ_007567 [Wickerhamomyces pijperi]